MLTVAMVVHLFTFTSFFPQMWLLKGAVERKWWQPTAQWRPTARHLTLPCSADAENA